MSGVSKKLMSASGGAGGGQIDISDYFSTYLYTGNGSTQTITNGIDLAGEGGLVWFKQRSAGGESHRLFDTQRGATKSLRSNGTNAEIIYSDSLTSFNSNGFSLGASAGSVGTNTSGSTYASWTFRKAPRFFDVVTYTGTGAARTVAHNLGTTVGSIIIKRTDTTSNWAVYHRGNTAAPETDFLSLNLANATADDATYWNDTAPTDSVFTVGTNAAVNASGGTYVAYLFAHDPLGPSGDGSDGLIACGSYTGNSSGENDDNGLEVNLGWEPQWVMIKSSTWSSGNWQIFDTMRGITARPTTTSRDGDDAVLFPNLSNAEDAGSSFLRVTPTGFKLESDNFDVNSSSHTYIYIAIRRGPMRAPTSGTEVFGMDDYTGGGDGPVSGFVTDMALLGQRAGTDKFFVSSRLTGDKYMLSPSSAAELSLANQKWDRMDGAWNTAVSGYMLWGFARAPEFFDVVAYTGDGVAGRTVSHNLGVAPEMMIVKRRNAANNFAVYAASLGNTNRVFLNQTQASAADPTLWNDTTPTDSVFTLGTAFATNNPNDTYISYHFATLAGVSKVGSYTGNGTSQTINCGFTTGARFIIIKRTDSTGDWYVWDTARGIVAANDPHLSLNTTAAEVTTDDSVDPDSSGFIVNQVAATNINVSAASYIFYAVA